MAIGIRVKRAEGEYDLSASKFFGAPAVPIEWDGIYGENEIFFCQINLEDIAHLDKENKLPHWGYLYVFLDTSNGEGYLKPVVRYTPDEPSVVISDFNESVKGFEYTEEWLMEFYEADDGENCSRLLGMPSDWSLEDSHPLLMQFAPDGDMGFLDELEGYMYLFFGEDRRRFTDVRLTAKHS